MPSLLYKKCRCALAFAHKRSSSTDLSSHVAATSAHRRTCRRIRGGKVGWRRERNWQPKFLRIGGERENWRSVVNARKKRQPSEASRLFQRLKSVQIASIVSSPFDNSLAHLSIRRFLEVRKAYVRKREEKMRALVEIKRHFKLELVRE